MHKTIKVRIDKDKQKLLEQLRQIPIVQVACQKCGIGRATYYRWHSEDKEFAREADKAINEGKRLINDLAESKLISAIQEQNMTGIIYWLRNNHPDYADRIELTHKTEKEELTNEQKKLVKKAIALTHGFRLEE